MGIAGNTQEFHASAPQHLPRSTHTRTRGCGGAGWQPNPCCSDATHPRRHPGKPPARTTAACPSQPAGRDDGRRRLRANVSKYTNARHQRIKHTISPKWRLQHLPKITTIQFTSYSSGLSKMPSQASACTQRPAIPASFVPGIQTSVQTWSCQSVTWRARRPAAAQTMAKALAHSPHRPRRVSSSLTGSLYRGKRVSAPQARQR